MILWHRRMSLLYAVVHLPNCSSVIHNHLWITLLQFGFFGKEVGSAYFYGLGGGIMQKYTDNYSPKKMEDREEICKFAHDKLHSHNEVSAFRHYNYNIG